MESIFDGETQVKALIVWLRCRERVRHFSGFENGSGNGSRGTILIEKMAESAIWSQKRILNLQGGSPSDSMESAPAPLPVPNTAPASAPVPAKSLFFAPKHSH